MAEFKLTRRQILLLLIVLLIFPIAVPFLISEPHQVPIQMNGSSTLTVPPDRATICLQVNAEGTKQHKVAEQVRKITDDILTILRPLTVPPSQNVTMMNKGSDTPYSIPLPPLVNLSVNAFSSNSYPRPSLLGETTTYSSTITITAIFRSLPALHKDPTYQQAVSDTQFQHLSLVLPQLAKIPQTKINYLKWSLSPESLSSLQSRVRQDATADAMTKVSDFITPMRLRSPSILCTSLNEEHRYKPTQHYVSDFDRMLKRQGGMLDYTNDIVLHDEGEGYGYGYEIERQKPEAFGLEPQSIEIESHINGRWKVVEGGLVKDLLGHWL